MLVLLFIVNLLTSTFGLLTEEDITEPLIFNGE